MKKTTNRRSPARYLLAVLLAALLLPLLGSGRAWAQEPIGAQVDRTTLTTDETLLLTVTLNTPAILNAPQPSLPDLTGFDLLGSSRSSQISIVNGDISSQAVYVYRLRPRQVGDLTIESIAVDLGGQTYRTQPIVVHVSQGSGRGAPAPAPESPAAPAADLAGQELYVEAAVDEARPYVGQQVVYIFRFYQAVNLWDQPQYQAPAFQGFWNGGQGEPQDYQTQAAGRTYRVTEVRTILFPSVLGPLAIEPARLTIPGGFFQRGQTLQTRPLELDVQPLPPDAPAGFDGAVGRFELAGTLDTGQGQVGEPLTWRVTLCGQGNLTAAPDPAWPDMAGWRSFESRATVDSQVRDGQMVGSRLYERLLVPALAGEFTIPALEYVYFDPDASEYHTLRTEPLPVSISPGSNAAALAAPPQASGQPPAGLPAVVEQAVDDIRHLKTVPPTLGQARQPLTGSGLYWAAWAVPLLGAAGYFTWQQRQRRWQQNSDLARFSRARQKARQALARAHKQGQEAYSAVGQILLGYLSDKMNRPLAGVTRQALAGLLAEQGLDAGLIERVQVLLANSELGRFAPGADDPDHARGLLQETDSLIAALEKAL